jgi:O-antigen/teichoic acid export membrane protein
VMRLLADRDGNLVFSATFPIYMLTAAFISSFGAVVIAFNGFEFSVFAAATLIVFFEGLTGYFINFWRAKNQPGKYALVEGGRAISLLIAVVGVLSFGYVLALKDFVALRTLVAIIAVVFALFGLRTRFSPDLAMAKKAIAFGFPMTVSALFLSMMLNFDRYPVHWLGGDSATTSYVAHVKLAQVLGAALGPFYIWYAPMAIKKLQRVDEDTKQFFSQSFYSFVSLNVALSTGLWMIAPSIWPFLFPSIVFDPKVFAILLTGTAVFSCGNPLSIGTLVDGRTWESLVVACSTVVLGIFLVWLLVLTYGVWGVAIAKLLASLFYSFAFGWRTNTQLKIGYSWSRLVSLVVVAFVVVGILRTGSFANFNSTTTVLMAPLFVLALLALAYVLRPPLRQTNFRSTAPFQ